MRNIEPDMIMKTKIFSLSVVGVGLLLAASPAEAAPEVAIHGTATHSENSIILNVYADASGVQLRSFGVLVSFDPQRLQLTEAVRYDGIWFLADEKGTRFPYSEPELLGKGRVRVIGGRLDGRAPALGATGPRILLTTLHFVRQGGELPELSLNLASSDPYVNFASTEGDALDKIVKGLGESVSFQEALPDKDNDRIPDDFEDDVFGGTEVSNGKSDFDRDGQDDYGEWLSGTNPKDPKSKLELTLLMLAEGAALLEWDGVAGRVYTVERSGSLNGFRPIAEGIPGNTAMNEVIDFEARERDRSFYRLSVQNPSVGR